MCSCFCLLLVAVYHLLAFHRHWNLNPNNQIRNLITWWKKKKLPYQILVKDVTTSPSSLRIKRTTTINTKHQFLLPVSFLVRGLRTPRADDRRSITGEIPSDRRCLRKFSFSFPIWCCKKERCLRYNHTSYCRLLEVKTWSRVHHHDSKSISLYIYTLVLNSDASSFFNLGPFVFIFLH